jgi:hypothetical protein
VSACQHKRWICAVCIKVLLSIQHHRTARPAVHQKGVHDEHTGTTTEVSTLFWSLFFQLFYFFRISDPDSEGQKRIIPTAAESTNFPCVTPK